MSKSINVKRNNQTPQTESFCVGGILSLIRMNSFRLYLILTLTGGCYPSMHCRWYPSMACSRSPGEGAIPACIAGGIPACLAAGFQRGLLPGGSAPGGGLLRGGGGGVTVCSGGRVETPRDGYCCGHPTGMHSCVKEFLFLQEFHPHFEVL